MLFVVVVDGVSAVNMTCNECRWKVERKECPWDFMYDEDNIDYAEDCIDYRTIYCDSDKFKNEQA